MTRFQTEVTLELKELAKFVKVSPKAFKLVEDSVTMKDYDDNGMGIGETADLLIHLANIK